MVHEYTPLEVWTDFFFRFETMSFRWKLNKQLFSLFLLYSYDFLKIPTFHCIFFDFEKIWLCGSSAEDPDELLLFGFGILLDNLVKWFEVELKHRTESELETFRSSIDELLEPLKKKNRQKPWSQRFDKWYNHP